MAVSYQFKSIAYLVLVSNVLHVVGVYYDLFLLEHLRVVFSHLLKEFTHCIWPLKGYLTGKGIVVLFRHHVFFDLGEVLELVENRVWVVVNDMDGVPVHGGVETERLEVIVHRADCLPILKIRPKKLLLSYFGPGVEDSWNRRKNRFFLQENP